VVNEPAPGQPEPVNTTQPVPTEQPQVPSNSF
jgi:hypothetical protein